MPYPFLGGPYDGAVMTGNDLNRGVRKWMSLQTKLGQGQQFVVLPTPQELETGQQSGKAPYVYQRFIGDRVEYRAVSPESLAQAVAIDAIIRGEPIGERPQGPDTLRGLIRELLAWANR